METTVRKVMFQREWLKDYKVIRKPMGKVEIQVANNVTEKNRVASTGPGGSDKYIINLKALTPESFEKLIALFPQGVTEVPIEETNGLFLNVTAWINNGEIPALPMRGEVINVAFDYVDDKEKTKKLLRATTYQLKPAEKAEALDFESFFTAIAEGAEAQEAAIVGADKDVLQQA